MIQSSDTSTEPDVLMGGFFSKVVPKGLRFLRALDAGVLGDLDPPQAFRRALERERARTDRSGEGFSLLAFTMDHQDTDRSATVRLARILKQRLRATDQAGWLDNGRIGVVLPGTPPAGAWKVAHDVCRMFPAGCPQPECEVFYYPSDSLQEFAPTGAVSGSGAGGRADPVQPMEVLFLQRLPLWKRTLDVLGASAGLLFLLPVMIAVAAAIKVSTPGPVFFQQWRSGLGGRPFRILKFRTMRVGAESQREQLLALNEQDGPAFKIRSDPRVTPVGRLLRSTSIDELPQLWNVLRGEMSLVGPRPLPVEETQACLGWHRRRLDVTPGLTCIWQISGRSSVSFAEWMRMDLAYIRTRNLRHDLKILLATVPAVIHSRGAC
jgi:lipopolysaccharide/colanic/teichoic acid biosynthesis glycosyltransferase